MAAPKTIELGSVLITGGCGFLGSHVVNQLLNFPSEASTGSGSGSEKDRMIQSPVRKPTGEPDTRFAVPPLAGRYPAYKNTKVSVLDLRTAHNRYPGADYYEADIMSIEQLLEVFRKLLYRINVDGTKNLLEVAGGMKGEWGGVCKAFVYTSSSSVVHDCHSDLIRADERWPLITGELQHEYYTETKAQAETLVLDFNKTSPTGMLTTAIRPAGIHGERDTTLTKGLTDHARKSSPFVLRFQLGENDNLFDFTYAGNVAYAHMLAAQCLLATFKRLESSAAAPLDHERVDGEAFNVTNDSPVYFWDMARSVWALMDKIVEPEKAIVLPEGALTVIGGLLEMVFGLFGKKPRMSRREVRFSCMTRYYSCEKAKVRMGYVPVVPLEEGVVRSVGTVLERDQGVEAKKAL
ncbi:sterol-4alpha-carboxylate 3-dehydrogenase (decarboxylating) [[Emmonsia] crescens]|uniref:Sterol-4alpha-carboxylate 3-dehydrogenase (Decarboxylating) n=1 Tax=[Emmonsia] crescens TaxID=73230 RepID=A0A0G2I582_9EURO|nr:sterol-4alpha-carboxylate 3-dehydrogenase (decarboxylating) [Emmonsia crescens UAMH 3008]